MCRMWEVSMDAKYHSCTLNTRNQLVNHQGCCEISQGESGCDNLGSGSDCRLNLQPWQANQVSWTLSQYDVSIWDVVSQQWIVPDGEFGVVVAKSSLDQGVRTTFTPKN